MSSIVPASKAPVKVAKSAPCPGASPLSLFTWDNPLESAKVLVGTLATLLVYKYTDFVSWTFYAITLFLAGSALAEYAGKLITGQGFVSKFKPVYTTRIGDFLEAHATILAAHFKQLELDLQDLFTAVNIERTFKAAIASYVLYLLTSSMGVWNVIFVSTILLFTVPYAYLSNKEVIDAAVQEYYKLTKQKSSETYQNLRVQAQPALQRVQAKFAETTSLVRSKLPTRTAGKTKKDTEHVSAPPSATEITGTAEKLAASIEDAGTTAASESEPLLN